MIAAKTDNRLKIILDIDQTLASAEATDEYDKKKYKLKSKKFNSI